MNRRKFFGNAAAGAVAAPTIAADVAQRVGFSLGGETAARTSPGSLLEKDHYNRVEAMLRPHRDTRALQDFYRSGGASWHPEHRLWSADIDELRSVSPAIKRIWKAERIRRHLVEEDSLAERAIRAIFGDSQPELLLTRGLPSWFRGDAK